MGTVNVKPASEVDREKRESELRREMADLKQRLDESDFKVLPDYDQDSDQIKVDRQEWRDRIREIEAELGVE